MSDPVTYTAVLPIAEETVQFVSSLLAVEQRRRRTRRRRRALGCYRQAVLLLRWFVDGTRPVQLAADNRIGRSTAYRYLHEGGPPVRPQRLPARTPRACHAGGHGRCGSPASHRIQHLGVLFATATSSRGAARRRRAPRPAETV